MKTNTDPLGHYHSYHGYPFKFSEFYLPKLKTRLQRLHPVNFSFFLQMETDWV